MGRWGVTSEPLRPPLWAQRPLGARMEGRALHAQSRADESSSVEPTPPVDSQEGWSWKGP